MQTASPSRKNVRKLLGGLRVRMSLLNRSSGLANDLDDNVRPGKHDDVAAVGLDRGRVHAFRQKALKVRMHSLVLLSEDVPARLRLPGNLVEILLLEQVGSGWVVGRPDQLLLLLGKVSREVLDAFRLNPDTSAGRPRSGRRFRLGICSVGSARSHEHPGRRRRCKPVPRRARRFRRR